MPSIVAVQMPQHCLARPDWHVAKAALLPARPPRPLARILPVCTARPVGSLHWPAQPVRSLAGRVELLAWQASK